MCNNHCETVLVNDPLLKGSELGQMSVACGNLSNQTLLTKNKFNRSSCSSA